MMDPPGSRIPLPDFFPPSDSEKDQEEQLEIVNNHFLGCIEAMQEHNISNRQQAKMNAISSGAEKQDCTTERTNRDTLDSKSSQETTTANAGNQFVAKQTVREKCKKWSTVKDSSAPEELTPQGPNTIVRRLTLSLEEWDAKQKETNLEGASGMDKSLVKSEATKPVEKGLRRPSKGRRASSADKTQLLPEASIGVSRLLGDCKAKAASDSRRLGGSSHHSNPKRFSGGTDFSVMRTKEVKRGLRRGSKVRRASSSDETHPLSEIYMPGRHLLGNSKTKAGADNRRLSSSGHHSKPTRSNASSDHSALSPKEVERGFRRASRVRRAPSAEGLIEREDGLYAGGWAVSPNRVSAPQRREVSVPFSDVESQLEEDPSQTLTENAHNLVRADPIDEVITGDLPQAQEVTTPSEGVKGSYSWIYGLLGMACFIVVPLISIIVYASHNDGEGMEKVSHSGSLGAIPDDIPVEDYVLSLLPAFTVSKIGALTDAMLNPQTQAYKWLLGDPRLSEYEGWRIVQRFALATLFYATGGETLWHRKDDWLSYDVDEYKWYSTTSFLYNPLFENIPTWYTDTMIEIFTRDEDDPQIRHFWLYANGLQGSIPPELFLMTALRSLDLASNRLGGPIPSQIGQLDKLEIGVLFGNELSGSIPSETGRMEAMLIFLAFLNEFSGAIPTELGLLDPWVVHIDSCRLTGAIPSELGLHTNMLGLHLYSNRLTSTIPTELGQMTSLQLLEINNNQLTGPIPSELSQLNTAKDLSVYIDYANSWFHGLGTLAGDNFDAWFSKGLALHENLLTAYIPTDIATLTSSLFFTVYSNMITGHIPSELGSMTDLEALLLFNNALTSTIPKELGSLDKLIGMGLSKNLLSGTMPTALTSMNALNVLWLQDNALTGTILPFGDQFASEEPFPNNELPSGLWDRRILGAEVDLSRNFFVGTISANLVGPKLVRLALSGNRLSGTISPKFGMHDWLEEIHVENNLLTGTITGSWRNLKSFRVGSNRLTGTLPSELCAINSSASPVFYCEDSLCGCSCPCSSG